MAGLLLTAIGLGVTIYTLTRVKRVQVAQDEARRFTQDLLNVDQLEVDLVRVIHKLGQTEDPAGPSLVGELALELGLIRGVRRALDESRGKKKLTLRRRVRRALDKVRGKQTDADVTVPIGSGFFSETFTSRNINSAKANIDITTGRTKLVSGFYVMDCLRQACQRGVKVRLIGLSPDAPDAIMEDALKTVSNPAPRDAADYRRQIRENQAEIIQALETWDPAVQQKFEYRLNCSVPRVSLLRCDSVINFGFLQFYQKAQPAELKDREYFEIPISTAVGKVSLQHFDLVWDESSIVFPRVQPAATQPKPVKGPGCESGVRGSASSEDSASA